MKYEYENHKMENELLPFIFHYDDIKSESQSIMEGNWHENTEFLYVVEGCGSIYLNGEKNDVEPDDLITINAEVFHGVRARHIGYYCLIIDETFFESNGLKKVDFISHVKHSGLGKKFNEIGRMYGEKPNLYVPKIRNVVLDLIIYMTDNFTADNTTENAFPEHVKQALIFIKENCCNRLTVNDIINHVGMSRAYFSREFKKSTGMSMITYLNYVRCKNAKNLLKHGESVGNAAMRCGFENLSYFSKTYKKIMEKMPSEEFNPSVF